MQKYEHDYMRMVRDIMTNGYFDTNRTINKTKKLPHQIIQVDLEKEFPILQTKFVGFKTAVKEMLWIYQKQSNIVQDLRDANVKIWDEWEREDGTIGKAYGYQLDKFHQVDDLICALKNNPQDRRMILNLWNNADLDDMALAPCCFLTIWDVTDGRLNCMLIQRSQDVPLGGPFNTTQFAVLTHMLAQVTGHRVGLLTHVVSNAHIYENQFEGMNEQIRRYEEHLSIMNEPVKELCLRHNIDTINTSIMVNATIPRLVINKDITDFYKFTPEDICLEDYIHMGKIVMEVSV